MQVIYYEGLGTAHHDPNYMLYREIRYPAPAGGGAVEFGNFLSSCGKFSTSLPCLTRARFRRVMGSGHGATRPGGDMRDYL